MIQKIAFTMYPVSDVARARQFYEETLGLTPGMAGGREGMWWIEYDLPGGGCLAITNTTGAKPGGGTVALEVLDLDRLIVELKAKDVEFKSDLIHGPNCRMAVCVDTEGNQLVLHQLNSKPGLPVRSKPARARPARGKPTPGRTGGGKPATRSRKARKR